MRLIQSIKSSGKLKLAAGDLRGAIELWPLWVRLGWNDILYRYRRSTLGPLWFTASMAITIVALGSVYSEVLRLPAGELMPHVCVGLIVWAFMNSTVLEAGDLFTGAESYIMPAPFFADSGYHPGKNTLMVDFSPSEFSRLRLQLARDRARENVTDNQLFLQYQMSLGAHGAHSF